MKLVKKILITNSAKTVITLWLEPWAEMYTMNPKSSLSIVGESDAEGDFEIEYRENEIVIHGWAGSICSVEL